MTDCRHPLTVSLCNVEQLRSEALSLSRSLSLSAVPDPLNSPMKWNVKDSKIRISKCAEVWFYKSTHRFMDFCCYAPISSHQSVLRGKSFCPVNYFHTPITRWCMSVQTSSVWFSAHSVPTEPPQSEPLARVASVEPIRSLINRSCSSRRR